MKNKIKAILIIAAIFAIFLVGVAGSGCLSNDNAGNGSILAPNGSSNATEPSNAADALRFKAEHEFYNGLLRDNGEPHRVIYIPANNRVVYLDFDDLMDFIDSGTGVFFFSRPVCPWCRDLLPTFLEVAEVAGMYVFYYDIDYDRSTHNENYVRILELLHHYLPVDDRNQTPGDPNFDENIKRVTVPHLFFVVDGQVVNEIMMNRHPLIASGDDAALHGFLLEKFMSVQVSQAAA